MILRVAGLSEWALGPAGRRPVAVRDGEPSESRYHDTDEMARDVRIDHRRL
jgi:hypothetical protein